MRPLERANTGERDSDGVGRVYIRGADKTPSFRSSPNHTPFLVVSRAITFSALWKIDAVELTGTSFIFMERCVCELTRGTLTCCRIFTRPSLNAKHNNSDATEIRAHADDACLKVQCQTVPSFQKKLSYPLSFGSKFYQ